MQSNIKVILFDHDDTLVGTRKAKFAQHKHVAKTYYGKDLSDEEIDLHWGKPLTQLVCLLYGTNDIEDALAKNYSSRVNFPKLLFKETIPTLKYLHSHNKLLGVITATTRNSFEHDLQSLGIPEKLFDYIQTAEDTKYHKPDPRVFEPTIAWLKGKNIDSKEVLYVADGLHDMKAALSIGFNFIGVETGLTTRTQFAENGVVSVTNVGSLVKIIK
ncbi:MAG TPA: HAD hydrolase-like protein [Candidatus Saccharimonadales bacterium]|nr:HAD hydrolase-like protein [Candidatus Saccharimonadales bacterium]